MSVANAVQGHLIFSLADDFLLFFESYPQGSCVCVRKVIKGYRRQKSTFLFYLSMLYFVLPVRPKPSLRPPKAVIASAQSRHCVRPKPSLRPPKAVIASA
ncbi:hypothetical protein CEK71_20250 [Methylovulum psychrotolerans]|uniref:Uncharacterized protein n=1 Tax=Methylovulum psychrotolerans TaxID=1704499 RepID=A0A1Z4C3Z4_9GAMM|nr:hypothetical protein CEK71_20250 [Methylovulum psychrotolerans]